MSWDWVMFFILMCGGEQKEEEDGFREKNEREVGERENNPGYGERRTVAVLGKKNIYVGSTSFELKLSF